MLEKLLTLLKDAAIYGGGSLLSQLLSFLLLPILTRQLTPTDYGVIGMLAIVPTVLTALATSGMKSAVFYQFNKCRDEAERATMLSTAMFGSCLTIGLIAGVALLFAGPVSVVLFGREQAVLEVSLTTVTAALTAAAEVPRAILQSFRRAQTVAAVSLSNLFLTTTVTIVLVVGLGRGVHGVVVGNLAGQFLSTAAMIWSLRRWWTWNMSVPVWKALRTYGWPYLPHRLVGVMMSFYGDYLVRERLGLHQTGLYGVASRFATPIGFLTGALLQAWQPFKFRILAEDGDPKSFFASTFTYVVGALSCVLIGLSAWGPEVVRVMTAPEFHEVSYLVWALSLMRVMQGIYPFLSTGVDVGDNTKQVPIASLASLVVLVAATALLVPLLGALGAALGTMLSWLTMSIAFYFISQRIYPIPYDWKAVFLIGALAGAFIAATQAWQPLAAGWRILAALSATVLFPATIWAVLGQSEIERHRMAMLGEVFRSRLLRARA